MPLGHLPTLLQLLGVLPADGPQPSASGGGQPQARRPHPVPGAPGVCDDD